MITSVDNKTIKELAKLQQKKYRDETNSYMIEGAHLITEALKNGVVKTIYTTLQNAEFPDAQLLSPHVMKKITDTKHTPPYAAHVKKQTTATVTERVLCLENIQDPGNLGTLLRSALAFGFTTVIFDQCVDLYNPKVLRSAQGAHFHLHCHFMSISEFHQAHPHRLIATSLTGKPFVPMPLPYALLLGNEGQGLTPQTLALADANITIPIETIDSLNVAVAGSIIMYTLKTTI